MLIEMEKSSQAQESVVQLSSRVEGLDGNGLAIGIDNYYDRARLLSTGHRLLVLPALSRMYADRQLLFNES